MGAAGALALAFLLPWQGQADTWHTVRPGQTLSHVARRYGLSQRVIASANRMGRGRVLTVGMRLRIPDGTEPTEDIGRRRPGSISFLRMNNAEEVRLQLVRTDGRVNPTARRRFRHLLRALPSDDTHLINERLLRLVQKVGDRWHTHRLVVVSGYREPANEPRAIARIPAGLRADRSSRGRASTRPAREPAGASAGRHSRHNEGQALDFRVDGVSNRVLRDFCKSFNRVGVGYYPNSTFVHLDVRRRSAYWVDWSRPGEAPRYRRAEADRDPDDEAPEATEQGANAEEADSEGAMHGPTSSVPAPGHFGRPVGL